MFIQSTSKITNSIFAFFLFIVELNRGFGANPEGKYLLSLKGPPLNLVGPYKINGRVLILPIQGVGRSNITLGMYYIF